ENDVTQPARFRRSFRYTCHGVDRPRVASPRRRFVAALVFCASDTPSHSWGRLFVSRRPLTERSRCLPKLEHKDVVCAVVLSLGNLLWSRGGRLDTLIPPTQFASLVLSSAGDSSTWR